jgi:hypothetical protein
MHKIRLHTNGRDTKANSTLFEILLITMTNHFCCVPGCHEHASLHKEVRLWQGQASEQQGGLGHAQDRQTPDSRGESDPEIKALQNHAFNAIKHAGHNG